MSYILLVALIVLQVLDVYSTKRLLDASQAREVNPVMAFIISKLGTTAGLIVPKLLTCVLVWLFLFTYPFVLAALVVAYVFVVHNNFSLIK